MSLSTLSVPPHVPWFKLLTRYHWFVFTVAALGWIFDCLDQQLFVLARPPAMEALVPEQETASSTEAARKWGGKIATSVFLAGWAMGGLFFGVLGDRIGRARVMMITILLYSACTGLSALSQTVWDFALYRFLTGLGVGGEFAVGVALVAEVIPAAARPYTLGLLQASSALGNISAALIYLGLGMAAEQGLVDSPWRLMFLVGALPALLALVIRTRLKEPEAWKRASHDDAVQKKLGSYRELFADPRWRRHAIGGLILGCAGIIGLWSVGFFTPDLTRQVQRPIVIAEVFGEKIAEATAAGQSDVAGKWRELQELQAQRGEIPVPLAEMHAQANKVIDGRLTHWASYASLMFNFGAFFGMFSFGALSQRIGRKPTFALAFIAAFLSTAAVFWFLNDLWQVFVLVPIMGFCQLSLFGGYAIYFPELFPTRLRSTGTSFCYNVGRFVAALGPLLSDAITKAFGSGLAATRYAGVIMCCVFLVGLLVLPFLPETRGKPLPE